MEEDEEGRTCHNRVEMMTGEWTEVELISQKERAGTTNYRIESIGSQELCVAYLLFTNAFLEERCSMLEFFNHMLTPWIKH